MSVYKIERDSYGQTRAYTISGYGITREKGIQLYTHETVSAADLKSGDWFATDMQFGQITNIWEISANYNGEPGKAYRVHTRSLVGDEDTDILGDMRFIDIYRPMIRPTLTPFDPMDKGSIWDRV